MLSRKPRESKIMLIDWFTIIAQVFNFLILVWLMKRFLYKPILNAIDAREKRIADELASADKKKAEAQKESDEFKHKNEEFDKQRAALLSKATQDAQTERQKLMDEARKAADVLSAKRQESLRNDTKNGLLNVLKTSSQSGTVRSAFDLAEGQRAAIQNALNVFFSADIHLKFETTPDLIGGIEFTSNGQRLAWSIADYLKSLEKGVDELLKEKEKSEAKTEPKPDDKKETKPEAKTV